MLKHMHLLADVLRKIIVYVMTSAMHYEYKLSYWYCQGSYKHTWWREIIVYS